MNVRPRVLVVDDENLLQSLLARWVSDDGFPCRTCSTRDQALELLERESFGIVVLDQFLHGALGTDIVRAVRTRKGPGLPYMVMVTGDDREELLAEAFRSGVDDFIRKPLGKVEFLARLNAGRRVVDLEEAVREQARTDVVRSLHTGGIRELSDVVLALAHDLRTPMATLRLAASSLRSRLSAAPEDTVQLVERIARVSDRLAETVDDVVAAFAGDDGSPEAWTEFDLAAETVRAVELVLPVARRSLETSLPGAPFVVVGNPFDLRRLVLNLVSNSLRHSGAGWLGISLAAGDDPAWARLDVEDDGVGIPADLLARLGEPLLLSSGDHRQQFFVKGNGLGLSICRSLAGRMGGRILISSGPGKGTRVRVWFRRREEEPAHGAGLCPMEVEVRG